MKKILLSIPIILLLTTIKCFSQSGVLRIGSKKYPATESFVFTRGNLLLDDEKINVYFAKNGLNGMIILNMPVDLSFGVHVTRLTGPIYIYLANGDMITCIDRGIRDKVDNTITAIYYLNKNEIELLKQEGIRKIRYSIIPDSGEKEDRTTSPYSPPHITGMSSLYKEFPGLKVSDSTNSSKEKENELAKITKAIKNLFENNE